MIFLRYKATKLMSLQSSRAMLSTQTSVAIQKLKDALEQYRQQHYTQELPARFKKEIVKAAAFQGDKVALDGLSRVLNNIGASNKLSQSEIQSIFSELGSRDDGLIPIQKMEQMI